MITGCYKWSVGSGQIFHEPKKFNSDHFNKTERKMIEESDMDESVNTDDADEEQVGFEIYCLLL